MGKRAASSLGRWAELSRGGARLRTKQYGNTLSGSDGEGTGKIAGDTGRQSRERYLDTV